MKTYRAFTFLEVILTVTIMAILITTVTAWTVDTLQRTELQTSTEALVAEIRSLQTAAQKNYRNNNHGILLESDQFTTYTGIDYDASEIEDRQVTNLANTLEISTITLNGGGSEVVFMKGSGETNTSGSFQIVKSNSGDSTTISISEIGLIDWQ